MATIKILTITQVIYAGSLFIVGFLLAKWLSIVANKVLAKRFTAHHSMLFKRLIFYTVFFLFFITGLQHLGFDLAVLLGAAGIFTVAIGFASQTSASNLVSGIFLLIEHPFKVGDSIQVKGNIGVVDSIDLLSTKLHTFDNTWVRIPNETMIKSEIVNLSRFKTRRAEITVGVGYDTDLQKAKDLLVAIAANNTYALKTPEPAVLVNDLADSSIILKYRVWAKTQELNLLKDSLTQSIQIEFNKAKIQIPYPQLTLHRSSV